ALLQAAQDRDRVLDRRLAHEHLLEAALERGVLLDVLAVFVERGRADAVQLAARERGLEHVAGVHRALGLAGADHGVQLVDEQDDLALVLGEVVEHRLEAFLELAAKLGAGDQRAHVQRQQALAAQALGHLVVDQALGQALGDRGLADAGLADQHRVVLGPALQHLDGAADLLVAADHRVELAGFGARGQVDGVLLERLARVLGVLVLHLLAAAHGVDGSLELLPGSAGILHRAPGGAAVVHRRQQEQFAGDEAVAALLRELVGHVEQPGQVVADGDAALLAGDLRQAVEDLAEALAQQRHVDAGLQQQRARAAALRVEQRRQQVRRLDQVVVAADGQRLGVRERLLEARGELVHAHGEVFLPAGELVPKCGRPAPVASRRKARESGADKMSATIPSCRSTATSHGRGRPRRPTTGRCSWTWTAAWWTSPTPPTGSASPPACAPPSRRWPPAWTARWRWSAAVRCAAWT